MRVRVPIVAAVLLLAVTGLSGCRSNVGTAANVNGDRISENSVNSYARPAGQSSKAIADAASQGSSLLPAKTIIVQYLVQREVYRRTLDANGDLPSAGDLSRIDGGSKVSDLRTQLPPVGVDSSFATVVAQTDKLRQVLITKLNIKTVDDAVAAVRKARVTVSVSPRYGSWLPNQLVVDSRGGLPSYLTLQSSAAQANLPG